MSDHEVFQKALIKEMKLSAVVLKRCRCGQAQYGWETCPSCGSAAVKEDKGVISYYHEALHMRVWFQIKSWVAAAVAWVKSWVKR